MSTGPIATSNGKLGPLEQRQAEQKPPKLPPRDFERKQKSKQSSKKSSKCISKDIEEENNCVLGKNVRHFGLIEINELKFTDYLFIIYLFVPVYR